MDVYRSVVMTGGAGMLAHALCAALAKRGIDVYAIDRDICDITQLDQVQRLFQDREPSLVINCAAHTAVDRCEDEPEQANAINGQGPAHLAIVCKEFGTRLVHYSTDFVFDGQIDRPYRTDDRPNPISAYGYSKLLGEDNIRQIAPPGWLIVRTAWLYGGHGHCFPQTVLKLAAAGKPLSIVDDQRGAPTHTVDLAAATLDLLDVGAAGTFHVTNAGETTWFSFAAAVLREFGVEASLTPISTAEWFRQRPQQAKRPAYSVLDLSDYRRVTGRDLRPWEEALHDYRASP